MDAVMFSSKTDNWATPQEFFNKLDAEIRFIRGRLKFGGAKNSAPFPSMIVIYQRNKKKGASL